MVVLFFLAALLATPTRWSSPSSNAAGFYPTATFCSGHTSSLAGSAVTSGEFVSFLAAVCAGVYSDAHMSHNMSAYVAENRTMYGVAQCRPDVSASECAACLTAASKFIAGKACATSAVWHDACFLRYSDRGPSLFGEDDYTATVFNASRALSLPLHQHKAEVRRLLAAAANSTTSSHMCRSVGSGTAGGGLLYGFTRCAAGISCDDCRRCLRGALEVVDRAYNASAGMQVLRLSCMAKYESYPFYNIKSLARRGVSKHSAFFPVDAAAPPPTTRINATAGSVLDITPMPAPFQAARINIVVLIYATGLAIAAIILTAFTIWYRRKRRPAQRGHVIEPLVLNCEEHSEEEEDDEGTSCQLYNYQVLESATCRFSTRNKLGSGGFGTVYKGTLENGKEVAVKRLRDSKRTIQELEKEISIVVNLRHKNLVRFLGYCFQEEGRFLIYEYVPNNSLDKIWYKVAASFQCEKLEWATWFNIILGVARGLRFLHDKGIIHRDLKPHNILLDINFNPKIADFDLMRVYDKQKTHESTEKVAGTFGYMAPECTSGRKFLLSIKSDVYSYGVLVLEIITGHKIYTFQGQDSEGLVEYVWQHWTEKRASDVVDVNLGVEGQEHASREALRCVHVALLCVQSDRARRPTMGQVIAMLRSDDGDAVLPEPSLPGYVVRPTAASGAQLCFGCR